MSKMITLKWDESLVAAIDEVRGGQTRSAWLRGLALRELGDGVVVKPVTVEDFKKAAGLKPASEVKPPGHRCPVSGCTFTAPSPAARCPQHPGKLVPA